MALIIILGLSVTVGIITYTMNKSKSQLVVNVSGFDKYTTSRNIAQSSINLMLRRMDNKEPAILDSLVPGKKALMITNLMGGRCSLTIKLANPAFLDTVDLTANARFMDSTYYMKLRLRRQPVPFPVVNAAVGLRIPNVDFSMSGSPSIDGRNHDINGNLIIPVDTSSRPGVSVLNPLDTAEVLAYASKINGTRDVVVDSSMSNPADFVQEYINAADTTFTSGVYGSNMTWGSLTNPRIIYCNGNVTFNGTIDGWGILVVRGNLTIGGNFKFRGLVVAYNEIVIDVTFAKGTPDIIGALLMSGPAGSDFDMRGNSQIDYSREALEYAKSISKLQWYKVVWWYESAEIPK
ncbi:MAG: hypothetical protein QME52_06695 [Bacteroidota bacterium]|nr:hypothetical protein [Bacteroidota bacterium]